MPYPRYCRQRFIIALLEHFDKGLSETELQKLLLLAQQETEISYYDFVPLRHGFHSFQAAGDLEALRRSGWIETRGGGIVPLRRLPSTKGLKKRETERLLRFIGSGAAWAERPPAARPARAVSPAGAPVLFTIGYEGVSLDAYVNQLLGQGIRLLCDIRRNPVSWKFGFAKKNLSELLPELGIEYLHLPELGILSGGRGPASDDPHLFDAYREGLKHRREQLSLLMELAGQYRRIALTCFERQASHCHRHCISDCLEKEGRLTVTHL